MLRFFTDGVGRSGAELAYFFLLSFFPLMIFASLLIGTFNININTVQSLLKGVIPSDVLNIALNYISYFTELQMDVLMYVGLGAALWSASRAVSSLSVAVNRAYRIEDGRNFIVQFLINIGFSAAMLVSIVLTIVILILGRGVLQYISKIVDIGSVQINAWHILRFVPITLLFFCILLFLYSVVPNKRIAFRQVIPGAIAAAISWLVTSIGFSFYVENMARYSFTLWLHWRRDCFNALALPDRRNLNYGRGAEPCALYRARTAGPCESFDSTQTAAEACRRGASQKKRRILRAPCRPASTKNRRSTKTPQTKETLEISGLIQPRGTSDAARFCRPFGTRRAPTRCGSARRASRRRARQRRR